MWLLVQRARACKVVGEGLAVAVPPHTRRPASLAGGGGAGGGAGAGAGAGASDSKDGDDGRSTIALTRGSGVVSDEAADALWAAFVSTVQASDLLQAVQAHAS